MKSKIIFLFGFISLATGGAAVGYSIYLLFQSVRYLLGFEMLFTLKDGLTLLGFITASMAAFILVLVLDTNKGRNAVKRHETNKYSDRKKVALWD